MRARDVRAANPMPRVAVRALKRARRSQLVSVPEVEVGMLTHVLTSAAVKCSCVIDALRRDLRFGLHRAKQFVREARSWMDMRATSGGLRPVLPVDSPPSRIEPAGPPFSWPARTRGMPTAAAAAAGRDA